MLPVSGDCGTYRHMSSCAGSTQQPNCSSRNAGRGNSGRLGGSIQNPAARFDAACGAGTNTELLGDLTANCVGKSAGGTKFNPAEECGGCRMTWHSIHDRRKLQALCMLSCMECLVMRQCPHAAAGLDSVPPAFLPTRMGLQLPRGSVFAPCAAQAAAKSELPVPSLPLPALPPPLLTPTPIPTPRNMGCDHQQGYNAASWQRRNHHAGGL